ncbi:MAG: DUF4837 family protein [Balneolaceae bacterium]|nr:DUF4837 family protein [Balneolaceae bacterium]
MSRLKIVFLALFASMLMIGCDGDFRELAKGNTREVVVVMDSSKWESQTANAIRNTFGRYVLTVPNGEPSYDLTFLDIHTQAQLDRIKRQKNIIFAAPFDEESNVGRQVRGFLDEQVEELVKQGNSFAFPLEDQWYRDQFALILTSTSDSALAAKIENTEEELVGRLFEKEMKRWTYFVFKKKEQTQFSDSMWANHGFKVRIQHDYVQGVDTTDFMTFRRPLTHNDRWMWVWWKNDVEDDSFVDADWINKMRDSLNQQYIKGSKDSRHVTTYYGSPRSRPVKTDQFETGDRLIGYETRGTWTMVNAAMGGPFVNFTYYDPLTDRLFMIEYAQFAPSVRKKLPFVRQFRAMGRTFESDSTWTPDSENKEGPAI